MPDAGSKGKLRSSVGAIGGLGACIFALGAQSAGLPLFDAAYSGDVPAGTHGACVIPLAPPEPDFGADVLDPEMLDLSGNSAERLADGNAIMRGGVQLKRGFTRLKADEVRYNEAESTVNADGGVEVWRNGVYVQAESGELALESRSATLPNASFALTEEYARGTASTLQLVDDPAGGAMATLEDALYTTCEPGDMSWALRASSVTLDQASQVGTARNVRLEVGGVPVFYTPYLSFPLSDQRKSGFLIPTGRVSSSNGAEVTLPYYFNIAPNQDATVSVRGMVRRGVQVAGEYRYLSGLGSSRASVEYLPNDLEYGHSRLGVSLEHDGQLSERWSADIGFDWVSDRDYFRDLGTTLNGTSTNYLEQQATLSYNGDGYDAFARVQGFQVLADDVADEDKPYRRLPQFVIQTKLPERNFALNYGALAEIVNFDRDVDSASGADTVTGQRAHVEPWLSFPMRKPGSFVVPRVSLAATHYNLRDTAAGVDNSPSRLLPRISVDGGLIFERGFEAAGRDWTHSIEPRAYYVYAPRKKQSDLPVFDTTEFTDGFETLFRPNRFAGIDRLGDDNRLTLALSSALRDSKTGTEQARVSLGQIRYFSDRDVQIEGDGDSDSASDLFGELDLRLATNWRLRYALQWDPSDEQTNRHTATLGYRGTDGRVLNASYRFIREGRVLPERSLEQIDLSAAWPLTHNLRAVGRLNHAVADGELVDAFAGLEYANCCVAVRTVLRRHLTERDQHSNSVMLQLELRGLSGIGRGTEAFITRSIAGYGNDF